MKIPMSIPIRLLLCLSFFSCHGRALIEPIAHDHIHIDEVSMKTPHGEIKPAEPTWSLQETFLDFLYGTRIGRTVRPLLTKSWASVVAGYYADSAISKRHIKSFVEQHAINPDESLRSLDEFTSFNDFFTRKLKPDARTIDRDEKVIVSPADGTIVVKEHITADTTFPLKGAHFNLARCLDDTGLAEEFMGGTLVLLRLAPWHYHRYHFPVDGIAQPAKPINGRYESVHAKVYGHGIQPLEENERQLIAYDTTICGKLLIIPVGALFVGRIVTTYDASSQHHKGEEAGYFAFGGSTIVLVFKKNSIKVREDLIAASELGNETPILMGEKIGNSCSK